MIDLKRILVPTDFSKFSQSALTYAAALAEKFGAELILLHVVQNPGIVVPDLGLTPPVLPDASLLQRAAQEALGRLIRASQLEQKPHRLEVREGPPFSEIIRCAREVQADLIVMGTHGHSGLAHVLLGSVTEKVVRKAPCPVLTVRHPEHEFVHP